MAGYTGCPAAMDAKFHENIIFQRIRNASIPPGGANEGSMAERGYANANKSE